MEPEFLVLAGVAMVNLVATAVVARNDAYSRRQKLLQAAMVWILPALGAVVCLVAARVDALAYRPVTEEFVDSAGAG